MNDRRVIRCAAAALLVLGGGWSVAGHTEQILAVTPLVHGSLATVTPFSLPGAGTVTVVLADLDWPQKLASLTFAATTPTAVLANLSGPGTTSFKVGSSGTYDAVVDAVASPQSFLDLGWYSMTIDFTPAVPLPSTALLTLSGLCALAVARGRKTAVTRTSRGVPKVPVPPDLKTWQV